MARMKAAVLGAGSWGTALAKLLADQDHPVKLWARTAEHSTEIEETRGNERYLPGVTLPASMSATGDLEEALDSSELVLWVVPSHGLRDVLERAGPFLRRGAIHCGAIKGIENDSLKTVSEIFEELIGENSGSALTYLGGPSFAKEVAAGVPTAVCVAGADSDAVQTVQRVLSTDRFRAYATEDVIGVELGGALKNVVAIAAGISDGLGFGHNARAALITRGLHEISRLAVARGANPLTMAGLGGMGDLVLTCTGDLSRNRSVGLKLGGGQKLSAILDSMQMVAEGVRTAKSAHALGQRDGVDMPIINEVHSVLYEDKPPPDAVAALMRRPLKHERR